jgi:hypothetical protein
MVKAVFTGGTNDEWTQPDWGYVVPQGRALKGGNAASQRSSSCSPAGPLPKWCDRRSSDDGWYVAM